MVPARGVRRMSKLTANLLLLFAAALWGPH